MYKALYPSEIDENNMAPDTLIGKVILPNQLDPKENRFNNDYFDRSVWFIEDLNSNNRLDFCKRYFNLADYEEMYDDIIEFFNVVRNSVSPLILVDSITGNQIMCRKINNEHNREMIKPLPDNKLRTMVYNIERMSKYDN